MEFQQLKRAVTAFLKDIKDQLGNEQYQVWSADLKLPSNLVRLNRGHIETVQALADTAGVDLQAYLPSEVTPKQVSPSGRRADEFAIYEKHPRTGEVILLTCERTVKTVIKQIQAADPDVASQIPWEDYGWTFLVAYTPQVQTFDVERTKEIVNDQGKKEFVTLITERDMRGQRSFPDYVENGKIETPGWRTSMPAELVLKQRISDWEVIPYDRSKDIGLANVSTYRHYDDMFVPTTRAEMHEHGWRYTKIQNRHDVNPYFAEDDTGRIKSGKASAANAETYFGYKNTRQKTKAKHSSGGKSPNPQNLPEYLQLASRQYKLPRINNLMPAKRFFLYYQDGYVWKKENHLEAEQVARFVWSDDRDAYIPIPMFPLSQGNNRRIWECVEGYLGLRGVKTARVHDLERKIRTPQTKYEVVLPSDVNHNRVGGDGQSKRAQREKRRQAARVKHRKSVKIC